MEFHMHAFLVLKASNGVISALACPDEPCWCIFTNVPAYDFHNMCNAAGKTEKKEHLLAESDDMWVALRHKHFAAATIEITRTLDEFRAKNKAAAYKQGNGSDGTLDMRNMRSLVSSLPQYR